MKYVWVVLLCLLVYQAPQPTLMAKPGFGCRTQDDWVRYNDAIGKSDSKTIRNIRLAQRCVDLPSGPVDVLSRQPGFLLIKAHAGRKLYIPKVYVIE